MKNFCKLKMLEVLAVTMIVVGVSGGSLHAFKSLNKVTTEQVESKVKNATVQIFACAYSNKCSGGTGFVVGSSDLGSFIVTNKHVCRGAELSLEDSKNKSEGLSKFDLVRVQTRSGIVGSGQILRVSDNADLCLIYARVKTKSSLKIAKSYKLRESVFSFGFPAGQPTTLRGIIKSQNVEGFGIYNESNMLAWFGISGGAVVNQSGEVVGVMAMLLSSAKDKKEQYSDRSKVYGSLFIPLEILREFLGGN